MRIEFHAHGQTLTPSLRDYGAAALETALRRFARRVRKVKVFLWDVNGPRGGVDKGVRVIVELAGGDAVLVRETAESPFAALARAAGRVRYAVRRSIDRRRTRRRSLAPRPAEVEPGTFVPAVSP